MSAFVEVRTRTDVNFTTTYVSGDGLIHGISGLTEDFANWLAERINGYELARAELAVLKAHVAAQGPA